MLALQDRPTPAPMGDADDENTTQIWKGSPVQVGGAGMEGARASMLPDAAVSDRRAHSEPPARDTIVDPPRSRWTRPWIRIQEGARRFADAMAHAFFGSVRLSQWLPPVPPMRSVSMTRVSVGVIPDQEYAEHMLLSLVRAPGMYQRAAVEVAYCALAARRAGEEAYTEFLVQFTLSRMAPDREGRITTERLRDRLCHMSYAGEIAPALVRLEARGIVALVLREPKDDPMREILREGITHVELRSRP